MKIRFLLSLLFLLSGCLVGPNYKPPVELLPDTFSENRSMDQCCIDENLAHWWTVFNDPLLNDLLAESLLRNFDLRIAIEKICQARANYRVQVAQIFPELDADVQVTRSRTSQTLTSTSAFDFPPIQSFYQAGIDAIWQIDIFGGLRRAARSAYNSWEASIEDARTVRVLILSEIAMTYTNIRALQQLQEIATQKVKLDEATLKLGNDLFEAGLTNEQEIETDIATLEDDRAALLVFDIQLKQAIYSLAVLVGRPPETFLEQFSSLEPIPNGCGKVPVGLPSDLLRRRPDIRSAERNLAAATEQIGVAVANLFPQLSLTGSSASFSANPLQGANIGFASNFFTKWFTAPSRIWGIGLLSSWPFFDFGKRRALVDEQVSIEHQSLLNYEKTVISALQEVESDLVAYFNEEIRLQSLNLAVEANRRSLDLISDLYQAGLNNLSQVLAAEEIWLNSLIDFTSSQQALTINLIALYKALGGGWECSYMP